MRPLQLVVPVIVSSVALGSMWPAAASTDRVPAVVLPAAATTLEVSVPGDRTLVGDDNDVTVQVQPAAKRDVDIQIRWINSGWTTVDSVRTRSSGTATGVWKAYTGDEFQVRAVAPATAGQKRIVSSSQVVTAAYGATVPPDAYDPMVPGRLTVSPRAQRQVDLGEYRVRVNAGVPANGSPRHGNGQGVTVTDSRGRVAWESDSGTSFVAASSNSVNWFSRSKAGAFWPDIARTARLTRQSITAVDRSGGGLTIRGKVRGGGESARYAVEMRQVQRTRTVAALTIDVSFGKTSAGQRVDSTMLTSGRGRGTPVHGFGEQFRPFDLSGEIIPILVQEQGVTRGEEPAARIVDLATWGAGNLNTTYAPWPTYVTGQKRSFELADDLHSGAFAVADMTRPTQISLESYQPQMRARVQSAGSPKDLMVARAAGSSRPELADWIQKGAVLGLQGGHRRRPRDRGRHEEGRDQDLGGLAAGLDRQAGHVIR